jgi:hypothetical protein
MRAEVEQWVASLPIAHLDGFDAITRRRMQAPRQEAIQ